MQADHAASLGAAKPRALTTCVLLAPQCARPCSLIYAAQAVMPSLPPIPPPCRPSRSCTRTSTL